MKKLQEWGVVFRLACSHWGIGFRHLFARWLVGKNYVIVSWRVHETYKHVYHMTPERFARHTMERNKMETISVSVWNKTLGAKYGHVEDPHELAEKEK